MASSFGAVVSVVDFGVQLTRTSFSIYKSARESDDLMRILSSRFDGAQANLRFLMSPGVQSRLSTDDIARISSLMLRCRASSAVLSTAAPLIRKKRKVDAQAVSYAQDVMLHLQDLETHIEIEYERLKR
jgi:hypothetical protein